MSSLIATLSNVPFGVWPAIAAFLGGGIVNASGRPGIRASFTRLGFPDWWCWVTAVLELGAAILMLMPQFRFIGIGLGACIMVAAVTAVLRRGDYRHLPPPILFLLLLMLAGLGQSA